MQWEEKFLLWIQNNVRGPFLTPFFQCVTHSTDKGAIWIAVAFGMTLFSATRRQGILCLLTLATEAIVVNLFFKHTIARLRPFETVEELRVLIEPPDDFSFPSGHTAVSFAAAASVFFSGYKIAAVVLFIFASLVGCSRLYLGVHYLTDVLAGAAIGILVAYFVHTAAGG